ncbi:MAG: PDZ domain-containing protein [Tenuifilaceae bacterium]|jgi:hypothetical protein|nr:PDZ domain-containing protein [Tenuifilaceae bacterium]
MNYKFSTVLLIGILSFVGCQQQVESKIPQGAFPIVYRSHLYIKGEADGVYGNYVFDTGASNLYYDSTYFADSSFSYSNIFKAKLPGVGAKAQSVVVVTDTVAFRFGDNVYRTSRVPVLQLKPILGDFADGILGMEYFSNSVLEISYEEEYMCIYSSIDSIDLHDWSKIDLVKRDNRLYIPLEVAINDTTTVSGEFLLDFGSGQSVSLTSVVAKQYRLNDITDSKVAYHTGYGGVGGESSRYDFFAPQLRVGPFSLDNVLINYSNDTAGAMASTKHLGLLGNDIYERFHVYIDFTNSHLYLKPNSRYNQPFEASRLGFTYVDRSQTLKAWVVTGLYALSPAQQSGLMVNDQIMAVNGVTIAGMDYKQQQQFLQDIDIINLAVARDGNLIELSFSLRPVLTAGNQGMARR